MTDKHTPGPWLFDEAGIYTEAGVTVANVQKVTDVDVTLIAAAPDLLNALRDLVCAADELTDGQIDPANGSSEREFWAAVDAARGSLAKAMQGFERFQ